MRFYRLLTLTTTVALWLSASSTKAQNPYETLGVKVEPLTLSKGKYVEFFDNETVVQIGTVLFNTETNQVVAFLKTDTLYSESNLSPEIISRWLSPDPLAKEFPSWSPYNYVENNPIKLTDPDGRAPDIYRFDEKGNYQGKTTAPGEHTGLVTGKNGFAFKFADPLNDPKSLDNGDITQLVNVSNSSVYNALKESGVYDSNNQNNKVDFISNQSNATSVNSEGKMDYVITAKLDNKTLPGIPDHALYLTDTKSGKYAHNNYNFGNFLWGAGANKLGFSEGTAKLGAHLNNYLNDPKHNGTFDSIDDQKSIHLGYEWPKKK